MMNKMTEEMAQNCLRELRAYAEDIEKILEEHKNGNKRALDEVRLELKHLALSIITNVL